MNFQRVWLVLLLFAWLARLGTAQTVPPTPTPIPLGELSAASEALTARLHEIDEDLKNDQVMQSVQSSLAVLTQEIDERTRETGLQQSRPDLETLRALEGRWKSLHNDLAASRSRLAARVAVLDVEVQQLQEVQVTWSRTLENVNRSDLPTNLIDGVRASLTSLPPLDSRLRERRGQLVALQQSVSAQEARVKKAQLGLKDTRSQAVSQIVAQDSPPLWNAEIRWEDVGASFLSQAQLLKLYLRGNLGPWLTPLFMFFTLLLLLRTARRRVAADLDILRSPLLTALVLSLMLGRSADPNAPPLLLAALGVAAVIPATLLLRHFIDKELTPLLSALVVCALLDQLRLLTALVPAVTRLLLAVEMMVGVFCLTLSILALKRSGRADLLPALRVVGGVLLAVLLADVVGFVSLATMAANAVLKGAYLAVVLYALLRIVDGLLTFASHVRPLSALRMVQNHGALIHRRIMFGLTLLAGLVWSLRFLELLALRAGVLGVLNGIAAASLGVGTLRASVGGILAFGVMLWISAQASRFARFSLEEEVFPHLSLGRGAPYAIATTIHYIILVIGIVLALSALGVNLTELTVVAGALSVGIGFGLQNIVKDFVSGLILLVDRPVNVGDTVKLGEFQGELRHIGMRSSILAVGDGSVVILPNSELINNRVVNWSFAGPSRRLELKITMTADNDLEKSLKVLRESALACPGIQSEPPPQAFLLGFAGTNLELQVWAWVDDAITAVAVKSDLTMHVMAALKEAGIMLVAPAVKA